MRVRKLLPLILVVTLAITLLPAASPARAATAAIGRMYATCGTISVDVAVSGTFDDGGGLDRFRYLITDGNGKKLYQEDTARRVGVTQGSLVINFSYDNDGADGPPGRNPIKFAVIDLDGAGNPIGTIREESYDAACLPPSGTATKSGDFRPPDVTRATFLTNSPIYMSPGGQQINGLTVLQGREHFALYRSADSRWIAVDVGGNDLVWVPVANVRVDISRIGTPPTRIDLANPALPAVSVPVVIPTTVPGLIGPQIALGQVTTLLRLRAAPSLDAMIVTRIPANRFVPIFGRNADGTWVKTLYNGYLGWVWSGFVILENYRLLDLPVVP
jgi:hypothetical protein